VSRELSSANTRLQHEISERERTAAALTESEKRLRLALMAANQGLYDVNLKTGETVVSPEYARMLGYEPDEFVETDAKFRKRLHDEDRERVHRAFKEHVTGVRGEYRAEFRQRTKSGEWKWIGSLGRVVAWDTAGRPLRMLGTHTDIAESKVLEQADRDQRQLAEALRDTAAALNSTLQLEEVLDRILDNIGRIAAYDAVFMVLLEGDGARLVRQRGVTLPPAGIAEDHGRYRLTDLPLLGPLLETRQACVVADTMNDPVRASGCRMIAGTRSCLGIPLEIRGKVAGAIVLTSAAPGHFTAETAQRLRAFASQASVAIENARLFLQAHQLSITDGLTGLNNRRHFFDEAKGEYERIRRYGRALAVVMIDIDHFKKLNDTHGHLVGDEVLREVARRIQEAVRTIDVVARYGGEEFAVLMPETELPEALKVAERICRRVAERPVYDSGVTVFTTVSLGVAEIDGQMTSFEEMLKCSDEALYAAKTAGRNRVEAYRAVG
jgi:diguanylate cyclase (GGDEF)-like protein/PAS domain S-box-containing protein